MSLFFGFSFDFGGTGRRKTTGLESHGFFRFFFDMSFLCNVYEIGRIGRKITTLVCQSRQYLKLKEFYSIDVFTRITRSNHSDSTFQLIISSFSCILPAKLTIRL